MFRVLMILCLISSDYLCHGLDGKVEITETGAKFPSLPSRGKLPASTPIVLWHGMGDNCCHEFSMGAIKKLLEDHLSGVHVHSLMIGNSANEDTLNGFFMSVNHQLEIACDRIKNDPLLANGYICTIKNVSILCHNSR